MKLWEYVWYNVRITDANDNTFEAYVNDWIDKEDSDEEFDSLDLIITKGNPFPSNEVELFENEIMKIDRLGERMPPR